MLKHCIFRFKIFPQWFYKNCKCNDCRFEPKCKCPKKDMNRQESINMKRIRIDGKIKTLVLQLSWHEQPPHKQQVLGSKPRRTIRYGVIDISRSYKKTPYCGDKKGRIKKRIANHKVRQHLKNTDIILSRSGHRRIMDSYDICDYYSIESWDDFWKFRVSLWHMIDAKYDRPFPDEKTERMNYERQFKRK